MKQKRTYKNLENYLSEVQSEGKLYFSINDLKNKFSNHSLNSIQMNLKRRKKKQIIEHIMKGFYVIIPPEYSRQKVLPPELFIDALFKYLNRPYYVSLLSAALYHGASHQQPQEYFVMIDRPPMRATEKKGLKINYVVKSNLVKSEIENKKTSTGYLKVSTPEQTAVDLIYFNNRIGGLNRAATILNELAESMEAKRLKIVLSNCRKNAALQRLGYILENIVDKNDLADVVSDYLKSKKLFRVPLKSNGKKGGFTVNSKWKIVENFKIEID